jgi:hypothetical protein
MKKHVMPLFIPLSALFGDFFDGWGFAYAEFHHLYGGGEALTPQSGASPPCCDVPAASASPLHLPHVP